MRYLARRRTVSTSFEQVRLDRTGQVDRKTRSYAYEMEELPKLDLKKKAMMNNFLLNQSSIVEEEEAGGQEGGLSCKESIPGLGILLTILCISIYQAGNVVAKKMTVNPFMMIFLRDFITLFYSVPFTVHAKSTPFPRGWQDRKN